MEFKRPPIAGLIGLVCAALGLLFQIVGVATTGWLVYKYPGTSIDISQGLWKTCSDPGSCMDVPDAAVTSWLEACRAFGILGLLVLAGCLAAGVLTSFLEISLLPLIASILGFVSGVLIMIEFAVFAGETEQTDYGYSFALTIIACLLGVAAGVCFFLTKKSTT